MLKTLNQNLLSGVDPDSDIIPLIAGGDQTAFAVLVDRHIGSLSALAAQMLGNVHSAEDITQTVFLKTWQMIPNWEPGRAKLITWMRRVATNLCLDQLRKHGPVYTDNVPDSPALDPSPEDSLADFEDANWIKQKLQILPDRQKAALTLFYYQELSLKEGAATMEISVDAFESLLRRARQSLKKAMQTQELSS